jgi:hypothetical protein
MRAYDVASGAHQETAFGSTTSVYVAHPSRPEVIIGRVAQTFAEVYNFAGDTYTLTSIPRSNFRMAEYNPEGTILYVTHWGSPYLSLFDADTLAPLTNPITDVVNFLDGEPRVSFVFSRTSPTAAISFTGDRFLGYYNVDTGAYIWDVYNPDAQWAYWSSINQGGDLVSVASDAFTLAQHTQVRQAADGVVVNYIASSSSTAFTHGVFTGLGDDIVVCGHATLADRVIDARTEALQYTLLGAAQTAVTPPQYIPPVVTSAFWTHFARSVEVI